MCPVYLQCLETGKKKSSALQLQIQSQRNYAMNRSWDNSFEALLRKCCRQSQLLMETVSPKQHQKRHWSMGIILRKYSAILAQILGRSWTDLLGKSSKGVRGKLLPWLPEAWLKFCTPSSNTELNVKQRGKPAFGCNQPLLFIILLQIPMKRADLPKASPSITSSHSPAVSRALCNKYVSFQSS